MCPSLEAYSSLHQDGGTGDVDSVHYNISGCDEYVLFPPTLTIKQKETVYNVLNTFSKKDKRHRSLLKMIEKECNYRQFQDRHDNAKFYLKRFPKKKELRILERSHNISYVRITLKPGELIFIKAGQLFACRKYGNLSLREKRDSTTQQHDFCWNATLSWNLLFIGYNKNNILSLAETKWGNNYFAHKLGFESGLGSIETPIFSMIHRYERMTEKECLSHISVLFSGLLPLICKIITIQSHYVPCSVYGEIIYKSESTKYRALKSQLQSRLMNERCESCGYILSNSFVTCTTCIHITDYTTNICLECYNNKMTNELRSSITSNLHNGDKTNFCQITYEKDERFESKSLQKCLCKEISSLPIPRNMLFIKSLTLPKLQRKKQHTKGCKKCSCECTKCFPMYCNCHTNFELIHWWLNEKEIRQILRFLIKNFGMHANLYWLFHTH